MYQLLIQIAMKEGKYAHFVIALSIFFISYCIIQFESDQESRDLHKDRLAPHYYCKKTIKPCQTMLLAMSIDANGQSGTIVELLNVQAKQGC